MLYRLQRLAFMMLVGCTLVATTACESDEEKATSTATDYAVVQALGLTEAKSSMVTKADQEALEANTEEDEDEPVDFDALQQTVIDVLGDQVTVEITEFTREGDTIFIDATVTGPDADEIVEVAITALQVGLSGMADADKDERTDSVNETLAGYLENRDIEQVTYERRIELRKEGSKWLVFADFETYFAAQPIYTEAEDLFRSSEYDQALAKLEEAREKIAGKNFPRLEEEINSLEATILYSEVSGYGFEGRYDEMLERYEMIVDEGYSEFLGSTDLENLTEKLEELRERRAKAEAQEDYMELIEFSNVELTSSFLGDNIEGKITNNGDRMIDRLILRASLLDSEGNEVDERTRTGIAAYGDEADQFKPGDTEEFRIPVNNAPDSWEQEFNLEIDELAFFEDR